MPELTDTQLAGKPRCPYCGWKLDGAMAAPDHPTAVPGDGDVGVCIKCLRPVVYTLQLGRYGLRKPTPTEAADIAQMPMIARVRTTLLAASRDPEKGWELR